MRFSVGKTLGAVAVLITAQVSAAGAQRVLDWPLRTSAEPEAVMRGVEAAFWNIAAIAPKSGRGEVMIADQRTPDAAAISGFAAAASWRLDVRTTVGGGYQHVGIDDIGETSTSPLPDTQQPSSSISEDQFVIGLAHALGSAVTAGAGIKYDRTNAGTFLPADVIAATGYRETSTTLEAGVLIRAPQPLHPTLGGIIATQDGGVDYAGGIQAGSAVRGVDISAGYGVRGGKQFRAAEHRIGITASWRQLVSATGGVVTAKTGSERSWQPVLGASLKVSRYELGVLRETLSNEFGSAYAFRFRIGLQ